MKKIIVVLVIISGCFFGLSSGEVKAVKPTVTSVVTVTPTEIPTPTQMPVKQNITDTTKGQITDSLELVLQNQATGKWNGINSLRKVVRLAIDKGVAANTIVLLLLLPLVATLVSVLHYVIGLSGYGIFMPTMIAVAFLSTGVVGGLVLFGLIMLISILGNLMLRRFKLHFWPARSINLLLISLGTFGLMVVSTYIKVVDVSRISIFPVLFMILLAEEFTRTQLAKSKSEAKSLMVGTIVLAITGAMVMNIKKLEEAVLLYPEVAILLVIVINVVVGSYTGMRLSEVKRFKVAIRDSVKKNKNKKSKSL